MNILCKEQGKVIRIVIISALIIALGISQLIIFQQKAQLKVQKNDTAKECAQIAEIQMFGFYENLKQISAAYQAYISGSKNGAEQNTAILMSLDDCFSNLAKVQVMLELSNITSDPGIFNSYVMAAQQQREIIFNGNLNAEDSVRGAGIAKQMIDDMLTVFPENPEDTSQFLNVFENITMDWNNKVQNNLDEFQKLFPDFIYSSDNIFNFS